MPDLTRREFSEKVGVAGLAVTAAASVVSPAIARASPRVVIVGGGAGGATVARQLKQTAPDIDVTLVEIGRAYSSPFLSEHFLGGFRSLNSLTHRFEGLAATGIKLVHDRATGIRAATRELALLSGATLAYDKLVISPGIDLNYESIEGYSREAAQNMPHAWKSGAQNVLLRNQLLDMKDGGVVVMTVPVGPWRGGTAPYARASMVAHYLKYHKPKSKLILLDGNRDFTQRSIFEEAWARNYSGILEHRLSTNTGDFSANRVDANTLEVEFSNGERIRGDVASVVPEQRAGLIAQNIGCTEGNWCPVDPSTLASRRVEHVHVLGDAAEMGNMPKTAFVANSQGVAVANHLASELAGKKKFPVRYRNAQWSLITTNNAIKTGASYSVGKGEIVEVSAFSSKVNEPESVRAQNFEESLQWYKTITDGLYGSA